MMLIISDNRIPEEAKNNLQRYGDVMFIETEGIVYDAVSGHPDIFFCDTGNGLIVAPNLPDGIKRKLKDYSAGFIEGDKAVGEKYPATASYNAVVTSKYLIHNLKVTDKAIFDNTGNLIKIDVKQAYTRCNLLPVKDDRFITSDKGIEKSLLRYRLEVLYVNPSDIILPGFRNGFFGGVCGVYENRVFIIGSLDKFGDGSNVRAFLKRLDMEIVELYDGELYDGGSLLFC